MDAIQAIERRLQALEDQIAIYQLVCGYGYAVDGANAEVLGSLFAEDGVFAVGDIGARRGREKIANIAREFSNAAAQGCAHVSTLPYVVIEGDQAAATCHTLLLRKNENGFYVDRVSACRMRLSRKAGGGWQIDHRQNYLQDGAPQGPAMLARLQEGPSAA